MTLLAPPNQQQPAFPPPHERNIWLAREWRHWKHLPLLTFALLLLLSTLLVVIAPLLPCAAYALWLWAAYSWEWRDRWTSIRVWAKKGSWLVTLLMAVAVLGVAHVWLVPEIIADVQAVWQAHLPGTLSLSPLALDALVARTLLLLPLAPALALCYERLDPRTCVRPRRILTPADLVAPTPRKTPDPASPPAQKARATASPAPPAPTSKTRSAKPRSTRPPLQQTTIESVLAADTAQTAQPPPTPAPETHPPAGKRINWDEVAE